MSEKKLSISLDLIDANPYQARSGEDPAVVAEVAADIERNGLMQVPTARAMDGRYQLAFGHMRLAAYKLLAGQGKADFKQMPLIVRELSDLQMFEWGVAENIKRRDLNPIETANAMRVYMDTFGKTSEEAADFFGVSAETVRGTVRLLGLPETVQQKVGNKEITVGTARSLLSLQKIAPDKMDDVVAEILEDGSVYDTPDEAIASTLDQTKNVVELQENTTPFLETTPKKFPFKYLEQLTPHQALRILGLKSGQMPLKTMRDHIQLIELGAEEGNPGLNGLSKDELEKLIVLVHPPQCIQCSLHAIVDGDHYCGLKDCYDRKMQAWEENELQSASKSLEIPIYDQQKDGKKVFLSSYVPGHEKLWKARGEDLRLIKRIGTNYSNWDGLNHRWASVVVIGKTAERLIKAQEDKEGDRPSPGTVDYKKRQELIAQNKHKVARFAWEVAVPAFITAVEGIQSFEMIRALWEAIDVYGRWVDQLDELDHTQSSSYWDKLAKEKPAKRLKMARALLIFDLLYLNNENQSLDTKKAVETLAKNLQKLAEAWGVKLPKTWLTTAAEWDAKETEKSSA